MKGRAEVRIAATQSMRRRSRAGRREARGSSPRRLPPRRSQRARRHQEACSSRSPSVHGPRAPQSPRHKSAVPRACSTNRHRGGRHHLRDPHARRSRRVWADHHSTYVRYRLSQAGVETIDEVRFQPTLLTPILRPDSSRRGKPRSGSRRATKTSRSLMRGIRFRTADRRGCDWRVSALPSAPLPVPGVRRPRWLAA